MIRKKEGDFQWLEFEILAEQADLVHGVILRQNGMRFDKNALITGARCLEENHKLFLQQLNISDFVCGRQVHGKNVVLVDNPSSEVGDCDGLITKQSKVALMVKHADCQAAIFYDPMQRCLANVHSGWRGNVQNIYKETVDKMRQEFGSKPEDLLVGISPSLGPNYSEFKHYKLEFPEEFWGFQVRPNYFDLWAIARFQLEQCGILPHHIEIAQMCTYANAQDCFSYRRDQVKSGHATFAMLNL
jgi:YfiH family protein